MTFLGKFHQEIKYLARLSSARVIVRLKSKSHLCTCICGSDWLMLAVKRSARVAPEVDLGESALQPMSISEL